MSEKDKKDKYNLNTDVAGKMLENVFTACDTTPNEVPFDKLILRSRQNFISDYLLIGITTVLLLISFILPAFFPHSKAFVSVNKDLVRQLKVVDSKMTDDTFSISFEGESLDIADSYMEGSDGSILTASSYDRESNMITFPYTPMEYNIYIYDINGKCIHLLLSPHN